MYPTNIINAKVVRMGWMDGWIGNSKQDVAHRQILSFVVFYVVFSRHSKGIPYRNSLLILLMESNKL